MVIRSEDLFGTFEQKRALVNQFTLLDDTFCSKVLEDKAACEYLLSALLGKPIKVIENKTQYSLRNLENHSVVLDALVEDDEHNIFDVEVQTEDEKNHERRLRYYSSAIDWSYLEKGKSYQELPDLYMIFISSFDPFKLNKNRYIIEKYIAGTDRKYDDGVHLYYFNVAVDDGTSLSKLLQYLKKSEAGNKSFGALSNAVNTIKSQKEGVESMCKAVNDYAKALVEERKPEWILEGKREGKIEGKREGKIENAVAMVTKMVKDGFDIEKALEYAEIDRQTYEKYSESLQ